MRSRPATPSQKFFRRTSQSPWEPKPHVTNSKEEIPTNLMGMTTTVISSRTIALQNNSKNSPTYLSYIQNQFGPNYASEKKISNSQQNSEINQPQKSFASPKMTKQKEQMKFTYIPIDSVGNKQSIPTIRKKGLQSLDSGSETKRSEDHIYNIKDVAKIKEQHQKLFQECNIKAIQNSKLISQLNIKNTNINSLQKQLKQVKTQLVDTQIQLKNLKQSYANLKLNFQTAELLIQKQKKDTKEISQKLKLIEMQLKLQKYQNNELMKIIDFKEKQLASSRIEIPASPKSSKALNANDRQNLLTQMRGMQARSISTYDNGISWHEKYKQNKQSNIQSKCNRFIQTENNNLEIALKQNQRLQASLAHTSNLVNSMKAEINLLQHKFKEAEEFSLRCQEYQKLIDQLNSQIIANETKKLAIKFKYH